MKKINLIYLFILLALVFILATHILVIKTPLGDGETRCSDVAFNLKQLKVTHTTGEGKNVTCNVNITKTGD